MPDLTERLFKVLKRHPTIKTKEQLAAHLGCSRSMLHHYERGNPPAPPELLERLTRLEVVLGIDGSTNDQAPPRSSYSTNDELRESRRIPVLGWAHAGEATAYEELKGDTVPTDCRDPDAFAVVLEGDSMEPSFREGDLLILMPGKRVHSGCLAVIRLADDGVLFRRIQIVADRYRLLPLNPRYETEEFSQDQISWIYPVWGSWRQLWK